MTVALAVVGLVLLAVGAGLVYLPAGLIVAGVGLVAAAYIRQYFVANRPRLAEHPLQRARRAA